MQGIVSTLVAASFCWFVASSVWIYPHSLSYFNELIGGPLSGPAHLLGSNVDWGQDLRYVTWYAKDRELQASSLALAYHGYFGPDDTGLSGVQPLSRETIAEARGKMSVGGAELKSDLSFCVVSANIAFGGEWPARDGAAKSKYRISPFIMQIMNSALVGKLTYSIWLYDVPRLDALNISDSSRIMFVRDEN